MTDDELKELVASLAIDQKELTKKMAQTEERFQETEEQMKSTDEQIKRNAEQMRLNDEKLDRKLDRIAEMIGGVSKNQGDVAEEFFFNSLIKDTRLGQIHFDDVVQNMKKHRGQIQEEYDLVLTNGDALAIVEVKYKAHENDLAKLERKMQNFKKLFPIYASFKQYGAIASFHINDDAKANALQRGYFVLQRSGDLIHTESGEQLTVL